MKFLVKFPTRSRPQIFQRVLHQWISRTKNLSRIKWLFTIDTDDVSMEGWSAPPAIIDNSIIDWGISKSKIDAVNRGMHLAGCDWDTVVLASDDMVPYDLAWDDAIEWEMKQLSCEVLHQNDALAGQKLNTLSILSQRTYKRFGYLYHPDYYSLFADNEFTEVTQNWGVAKYTDRIIIRHGWTNITTYDRLHARNTTGPVHERDCRVWQARKAAGYPRESVLASLGLEVP